MAVWTFSGYNNGRGAEITFTYTTSYNPATNTTTVTITNYTAAFNTGGVSAYSSLTGTFKVTASDNAESSGSFEVSASKSNSNSPTVSIDVSEIIEVSHGIGASKNVTLSFTGTINANAYYTYPNESTTILCYTATPYKLTINKGAGTNLVVDLYSSPFQNTVVGLSNGATIYNGDVIRVWGSASSSAYTNFVLNVSGVGNVSTGTTCPVTGNVTVKTTAEVKSYSLKLKPDTGSTITVNRTSSPLKGAATGRLTSGAIVYHNDVLTILFVASPGYGLVTTTVNGSDFTSGNPHTVEGDVTVATTTKQLGLVYIDNGTTLEAYLIYIDNGSTWDQYAPYIDNGTSWDLFS